MKSHERNADDEKDRTVLYCFDEYFDQTIEVLEEMKKEMPNLISEIGSPLANGLNYSFYAICSSRRASTYNMWIDKIISHAINYLFANIIKIHSVFMRH